MRRVVLVLLAACGGAKPHTDPVKDLTEFLPATLEADHPKQGDARSLHVRVWADAAVRANPHWKDNINDELDGASQLLAPLVGAKLVVDDIKPWDRAGDPHAALAALAQVDPGKDEAWVIGYIAPDEIASDAMAELGDAETLGRHVIVRAWAEQPETAALQARLAGLTASQRAEVLGAHRRHKQAVVLLHELGRSAGAIEDSDPTWIMHGTYSPEQSTFADRNRELLQISVDGRLADESEGQLAHDLLESIGKDDWGGWVADDKQRVVAALRGVSEVAKTGETAKDVPAAASDDFERVRTLAQAGKVDEALNQLENLLIAYPANATMYELKCELLITKPGIKHKATRAACTHTAELAPGDPTVHFTVGEALAKAGDLAGARAELVQAAGKIGNLKMGQEDAWRRLVGIYSAMGALTWTEEAIAAAGPALAKDPTAAQVAQTRARYGVPKGYRLKPEAEPALVGAVKGALELVYGGKFGEAEHAIATGERKWPGAPGLAAVRCDLELREGRVDGARAACARALAKDPEESWALYLSGVLALRDTSAAGTKAGVEKLKKAIAVDPELAQAWRALGKAYERAADKEALEELGKEYEAKFGQALPM